MYNKYTFPLIKIKLNIKTHTTREGSINMAYNLHPTNISRMPLLSVGIPAADLAPEQVLNVKALATPSRNKGIKASAECTSKLVGRPAPNDPTFAQNQNERSFPLTTQQQTLSQYGAEDPAKK